GAPCDGAAPAPGGPRGPGRLAASRRRDDTPVCRPRGGRRGPEDAGGTEPGVEDQVQARAVAGVPSGRRGAREAQAGRRGEASRRPPRRGPPAAQAHRQARALTPRARTPMLLPPGQLALPRPPAPAAVPPAPGTPRTARLPPPS